MNTYKGKFVPEHVLSPDITRCCASVRWPNCKELDCPDCILSHLLPEDDDDNCADNTELFKEWIAADRPFDKEKTK